MPASTPRPTPPAARDEFDRLNEQWGLTAFKLSPYRIDMHAHRWGEVVRTSAEYFRQLRETVRADYEIAFDAHAKIFEPAQAMQLGNALAPYDPLFFEEPIRPENFEAWGELKRGLQCTLATGESLYSRFEFLRLLRCAAPTSSSPTSASSAACWRCGRSPRSPRRISSPSRPHNPMGPLATAVNLHFCGGAANFRFLEYRLPHGPGYVFGTGSGETDARPAPAGRLVREGPLSAQGRPSRTAAGSAGWGVEMDEELLGTEDYVHWERNVTFKPDGASSYV